MYLHSASRCTGSSSMAMHEVGVQCTPYSVIAYRDTNIRHEPARCVSRPHEHYRYISSLVYCVSRAFHFILYGTSSWFTGYPHEERRCRILRPLLASNVPFLACFLPFSTLGVRYSLTRPAVFAASPCPACNFLVASWLRREKESCERRRRKKRWGRTTLTRSPTKPPRRWPRSWQYRIEIRCVKMSQAAWLARQELSLARKLLILERV